jgi:multidrug efflux pump subunit AcrB
MWIVKIALNRPYTFIVLALLILIMSPVVILRTSTDVFPSINIPVVAVAWTYTGLMILIFLGSWRSTVNIAISIPLSILTSVIV